MKTHITLLNPAHTGYAETLKTIDSDSYVISDGFVWFNNGQDLVYMAAVGYVLSVEIERQ